MPSVLRLFVANNGARAMRAAFADSERFACEAKVDGVRGLLVFDGEIVHATGWRGAGQESDG